MKATYIIFILISLNAICASRPNLIVIMADDLGYGDIGSYGAKPKNLKTPNIDQLATDGIAFDRHYDTTAICMASRANVMTGMFEYKTGCNFEHAAGHVGGLRHPFDEIGGV